MAMALFPAQRIFQSADRVLHLAGGLVGIAFSFQLLVAEDLSGGFFHGSLGLLCRTLDSIFVHTMRRAERPSHEKKLARKQLMSDFKLTSGTHAGATCRGR